MKTLVILCVLAAVVAFILGVIGFIIPGELLVPAVKWNDLCQTLLLFALGFAAWEYMSKK